MTEQSQVLRLNSKPPIVNVRAEEIHVLQGDWSFPERKSISDERRPGRPSSGSRELADMVCDERLGQ